MIESRLENGLLCLTLNDPATGNAFSLSAAQSLLAKIKQSKFRALIFTAEGRLFCSGGQLKDYAKMKTAAQGKKVNREISDVLKAVAALPVPTICLVSGDCYGGGLELMSAFDRVIAAPDVLFGFWQRKIGLSPGWGGGSRLAQRLPLHILKAWALEARTLSAQEAFRHHLIDEICLRKDMMNLAHLWLKKTQDGPQFSLPTLKKWSPKDERKIFEALWWNKEHRQVLKSRS